MRIIKLLYNEAVKNLAYLLGIIVFVVIMVISLISSSLNGIFTAAVYTHAMDEQVGLFDESLVRNAVITQ